MRKFHGDTLLVATHNAGKLEEIANLLAPHDVQVTGAAEMGLAEPRETEKTFVGNARIKAHAAARATDLPALSDDSGIEIDALGGQPGVYTANWAESETGRDFRMAMVKTHDLLRNPSPGRRGFAVRSCWPGRTVMTRSFPAPSKAGSSGRCAVKRGTGTTRYFSPTLMTSLSAKWTAGRKTESAIARMRSVNS